MDNNETTVTKTDETTDAYPSPDHKPPTPPTWVKKLRKGKPALIPSDMMDGLVALNTAGQVKLEDAEAVGRWLETNNWWNVHVFLGEHPDLHKHGLKYGFREDFPRGANSEGKPAFREIPPAI